MNSKGNTRVILLNGPPGSGKDTAAEMLSLYMMPQHELKKVLHIHVLKNYGLTEEEWEWMYRRENKEVPQLKLEGKTPREAMIHMSEEVLKPLHGKDYFAQYTAEHLIPNVINVISDAGFQDEVRVMKEILGKDNVLIIRLHRKGCDFSHDSRNYVYDNECMSVDVNNNSTKTELRIFLYTWLSQWFK